MTDYRTDHEYRGLLAAMIASPADDLPRLAMADWLDDNGQGERAEFIRVQIALRNWRKLSKGEPLDGTKTGKKEPPPQGE